MGLRLDLLRGIYAHGFENPSEIQSKVIVPIISGRDIIAQAQSGTGKTGTFIISSLQGVDLNMNACQVLMLSPTRELAQQSHGIALDIGKYLFKDIPCACRLAVGGTRIGDDLHAFRQAQPKILIGTPGRIHDYLNRKLVRTDSLHLLVLDEADELLSQGFTDIIYEIFKLLPPSTQVALFSATMPPEVLELTQKFMDNPIHELVEKEQLSLDGIKQFYVDISDEVKFETLKDIYGSISIAQSIIFCNSRKRAIDLSDKMDKDGYTVSCIHGELLKEERNHVIEIFKSGASRVLVATDIVARGLDVQHVNIVINYDIPYNRENYLHRIGRAGRYGRKGLTINFVTPRDRPSIIDLEEHYNIEIEELPVNFGECLT